MPIGCCTMRANIFIQLNIKQVQNSKYDNEVETTKKHHNRIESLKRCPFSEGVKTQKDPQKTQKDPAKTQKDPAKKTQKDPVSDPKRPSSKKIGKKPKNFSCEFCDSKFTTFAHQRRHEKYRCKENPDLMDKIIGVKNTKIKILENTKGHLEVVKETLVSKNDELKNENNKLILEQEKLRLEKEEWKKEKLSLYDKMDTLIEKVGDTTNIQNNIILNNYGNEDLSHITDKIKTELLKIPFTAIPKMIEAIHFNDDKPENKNIVLPNKKENLVKVYTGDKWVYKNKIDTLNDIIDSKYMIIDEHYDNITENNELPRTQKTKYIKFRKFYDEKDKDMVEKLKKECELVLLNNR